MRDAGCGMRDAGCGMRDAGCGMRDVGCGMRDAGCGMRDAGCGVTVRGHDAVLTRPFRIPLPASRFPPYPWEMPSQRQPGRAFASDNWAGVHPEVLAAMAAANFGHVPSYGEDPYTREAEERIRALVGDDAE